MLTLSKEDCAEIDRGIANYDRLDSDGDVRLKHPMNGKLYYMVSNNNAFVRADALHAIGALLKAIEENE